MVAVESRKKPDVAVNEDEGKSGVDALLQGGRRQWVVKVANDITYGRMERTMQNLLDLHQRGQLSHLHRVLEPPSTVPDGMEEDAVHNWFDETLNLSQQAAVRFALASPDLALIYAPPGMGKTQTLIEVFQQ